MEQPCSSLYLGSKCCMRLQRLWRRYLLYTRFYDEHNVLDEQSAAFTQQCAALPLAGLTDRLLELKIECCNQLLPSSAPTNCCTQLLYPAAATHCPNLLLQSNVDTLSRHLAEPACLCNSLVQLAVGSVMRIGSLGAASKHEHLQANWQEGPQTLHQLHKCQCSNVIQ